MASGRVSKVKGKVVDIPNPPTIGTATAGAESVSIAFTAYSGGAGGPTRSYIAKSNPGNITATGSTSPINVTGLTAGTSYTISVAGVNPTGTGEYSSASGSATPTVATSYESIATTTVGAGGTATITFSSIPSTYEHLQLRIFAATNRATYALDNVFVTFNGDSAGNYSIHELIGDGASAGASATANNTNVRSGTLPSSAAPNVFGVSIFDILDYKNTNKYKTTRSLSGFDLNGTVSGYGGYVQLYSGNWRSTNAITTITLNRQSGSNFIQYSHFALYGIKGA